MSGQLWPEFDTRLRIKLQEKEEPRVTVDQHSRKVAGTEGQDLAARYKNLAQCVYETIKEVVPEKQWIKKNGRVVTQATKELFERRAQEFSRQGKTSKARQQKWNRLIRNACRKQRVPSLGVNLGAENRGCRQQRKRQRNLQRVQSAERLKTTFNHKANDALVRNRIEGKSSRKTWS